VFTSTLTSTEKLVLLAILSHWSRADRNPWPGAARLSKWTSLHPKAILRILKSLETKGALSVVRSNGRTNRYSLTAVFGARLPVAESDRSSTVTGNPELPDRDPSVTGPVTQGYPNGSNEVIQEGVHVPTPPAPAPLALVPTPPKKATRPKPSKKSTTEEPDPRVTALRDFYVEAYIAAKGTKPLLTPQQWPRAMKAFKGLLEAAKDLELAKSIVRRSFADEWHRQNQCQPWEIANNANKFVGTQTRKTNGRGPLQPNSGLVKQEKYVRES
jgi:hypothetical protein